MGNCALPVQHACQLVSMLPGSMAELSSPICRLVLAGKSLLACECETRFAYADSWLWAYCSSLNSLLLLHPFFAARAIVTHVVADSEVESDVDEVEENGDMVEDEETALVQMR
jgi:hypothetical protein